MGWLETEALRQGRLEAAHADVAVVGGDGGSTVAPTRCGGGGGWI